MDEIDFLLDGAPLRLAGPGERLTWKMYQDALRTMFGEDDVATQTTTKLPVQFPPNKGKPAPKPKGGKR